MEKYKQVDCLGKKDGEVEIVDHATLQDSCENKQEKKFGLRAVCVARETEANVVLSCWGRNYKMVSDTNKSCGCSTLRREV